MAGVQVPGGSWGRQKPRLGARPDRTHPLLPRAACYLFNEGGGLTAYDLAAGVYPGAIDAAVAWATGRTGPVLKFAATTANAPVGAVKLGPVGVVLSATWWFSMWFNPSPGNDSYATLLSDPDGSYGIWYRGATRQVDYYAAGDHNSTATLVENRWHHVAASVDNGNVQLFIDGQPDIAFALTPTQAAKTYVYVGNDSFSDTFVGLIDCLFLADGRTLSAQGVAELYRNPYVPFLPPRAPAAWAVMGGVAAPPAAAANPAALLMAM